MSFVLESPSMGPCRSFCWVVVLPGGKAEVTIYRDKATVFPSKSEARRILAQVAVPQIEFRPVEYS